MPDSDHRGAAQDPEELFDVVDAEGRPTAAVKARALVHRDGDWHRAVHVWIAGVDADAVPFLLFQVRSVHKDTWPGRLDATVGGHLRAGEALEDALREVEEEVGIDPARASLRRLGRRAAVHEDAPLRDREIQDVLLLRDDRPLAAYRPHPAELAALVRFDLHALTAFTFAPDAAITGEVAVPGSSPTARRRFLGRDFVPHRDGYHARVVAAAAVVAGSEPARR